ncbi:MAG: NUDIX domain-containing protein [Ghiorsea sp.]|nr:NUDIX domain-containing protein [Ghiorsea sp.]
MHWQVHVHQHQQQGIWLTQRPKQGIWAGLWTPPIVELEDKPEAKPDYIHQLTHRRIHLYLKGQQGQPAGSGQWFKSWEGLAVPTGIHKLFEQKV